MSSSCPEPALLSADTSVCACAADAVGYRGFVDLFIVISVGISSIVVLFRLVYRVKPGSAASEAAAQQVAMPRAASMRAIGSGASSNNVTGKRGSVKDRLENEIRSLLPRRSTYYAMPFFADTVANKQEFIDSLIELGDDALDGWLLVKRGVQRGKNWKKRYVVLDGNGRIKYYQNAEAARKNVNIKGSLTVHAVKPADPMEFGANTLEVRGTLGGTYFFRPEGEMAARKWLCVLTRRAIQGRVPGRIDADPSAALLAATNGEANGESSAITASGSGESATDPVLKSHKLEAFIEDMTYGKEASLRQFYVVVKFKSELHDHSSVPVGQTVPKPCEKSVINWQENLSWHFMDHPCVECEECKATGLSTGSFKGLPDIMVLHVYEIHLRYLTTKIGQVALSLKEVFGFTGMKEATMNCKWPIMSNTDTVLGQLGLKLQYSVELGGGAAAVPFLVTTDAERELLGEYEIHPAIKDCREFFDLFYSSPKTLARWQAYYKSRGDTELDIGEWSESSEYGGQVRVVGCRALTNASIGPASTMTSDTQHVFFADSADSDPEKLVIESRVFMHDIPYGDCFTVEKVYTITRGPNGNLVAKCTLGIPFTKGCMFKSKIISATRESVTQATKLMYEELNKTMEGDGSVSMNVPARSFLVSTEDERHFIGQYDIHPGIKDPMQFFELFYANGTGPKWTAFYKETGDTDHEITEWKQSLDHGGKIRTIKYRAQNTAPIGPPSSSATNDQHVKLPADEDDSLVLESKMELYDIPYGDCFTVETVYVVERSATSKNLVAKVYVGIPFTKSTMFKGKIVSGTRDGVTKTSVKVFGYIHKVMESEGAQADAGRGSEIDAGGRRSVTDEGRGSMPGRRVMMARVNSTLDGSVALEEIFENQRVSIFGKWGPNHLLPTDRSRFTNRNGDVELSFEQISLPPHWTWTSPWKIDKSYTECDEEGWSYATDFPRFKSHLARGKSSNKKLGASVRRRRWIRMMAYVPPEPVAPLAGVASSGTSPSASGANENSTTGALTAP